MRAVTIGSTATGAALAMIAACGSSSNSAFSLDGATDTVPSAPEGLSATQSPGDFDVVVLEWKPPASPVTRYEVQVRIAAADWQPVTGPILFSTNQLSLRLYEGTLEVVTLTFRLRASSNAGTSEWSNEAPFFRGVRPASNLAVYTPGFGIPVSLVWSRGSRQAQRLKLERRVVAADGSAGPWAELPGVQVADTTYTDADIAQWVDGGQLFYRLTYVKDGVESAPVTAGTMAANPLAPVNLAATPAGPALIRLTWIARSRYADKQVVIRGFRIGPGSEEVAVLPREQSSYTDPVPASGVYWYRISARVGPYVNVTNYVSDSETVQGCTELPPDRPFIVGGLRMPAATHAARNAAGRFGLAGPFRPPTPGLQVFSPRDTDWDTHAIDGNDQLVAAGVLYAAEDRQHVLHAAGPAAPATDEWFDGTAWHVDAVGLPISEAVVDPAGAIHAVSCGPDTSITYATNAGGAWTKVSTPVPDFPAGCRIAVSSDGVARLLYLRQRVPETFKADILVLVRSAAGWTPPDVVPIGEDGVSAFNPTPILRVFAPTSAGTTVLYEAFSTTGQGALRAIHHDAASGWGAPVTLGPSRFSGIGTAAVSADGSRIGLAWTEPGVATRVAMRDASGTWTATTVFPTYAGVTVGFTAGGKLWVLDGLGFLPGEPSDYLLYEER